MHIKINYFSILKWFLELDALGDDMFLEDDIGYLDEASSAPAVPGTMPGETDTSSSKTKVWF